MDSNPLLSKDEGCVAVAAGLGRTSSEDAGPRRATDWICVAASRNVLVIDDNDRHLDILSTILRGVGNDVETCGSGAEALRRLDGRRYDVVVLDLVMPEISGLAVAAHMRENGLNVRTPLIACTANVTLAGRELEGVPGVIAIVGKPIDSASLVLAVARAPERQREDAQADEIRL